MKLTLCVEQTLGHRTHTKNIEVAAAERGRDADVIRVEFEESRFRVPWTVRASMAARRELRRRPSSDMTLFHTQAVSLFARSATRGGKYVVSLDATPRQMDALGHWYLHRKQWAGIENAKDLAYRRVFGTAAALVTWSDWAKDSLVKDYGQSASKIAVISPGAGPEFFSIDRKSRPGRPRILFVGGDFERKGGEVLLHAFESLGKRAELVLVTGASVRPLPGVTVIANATPGSAILRQAFVEADIFCLPTLADCGPIAVLEGMAAGLPVVTTAVGAIPSDVVDGENGVLVSPGSHEELLESLTLLVDDCSLRTRLGNAARASALERFDAQRNAAKLLNLMESLC
jgi:glycosyltransferase involved in cell wall biosynthesis